MTSVNAQLDEFLEAATQFRQNIDKPREYANLKGQILKYEVVCLTAIDILRSKKFHNLIKA